MHCCIWLKCCVRSDAKWARLSLWFLLLFTLDLQIENALQHRPSPDFDFTVAWKYSKDSTTAVSRFVVEQLERYWRAKPHEMHEELVCMRRQIRKRPGGRGFGHFPLLPYSVSILLTHLKCQRLCYAFIESSLIRLFSFVFILLQCSGSNRVNFTLVSMYHRVYKYVSVCVCVCFRLSTQICWTRRKQSRAAYTCGAV